MVAVPTPLPTLLKTLLLSRTGDALTRWLDGGLMATPQDLQPLQSAYTSAPRVLGRGVLTLTSDEGRALAASAPDLEVRGWSLFDAARVMLLLHLAELWLAEDFIRAATSCYALGDAREQQSWLRGLPLLPYPDQFLATALDACRTNITPVFEAIACENAYPVRHFPALHFNQLVLRSLFLGVALERIVGRDSRLNPTLTQMVQDFAAERRAAGRPVPADLPLALHA